ncbi:MAG: pyridoxal phosphate-dependent aminotransferase [Elusimicrobia bacterium]|nr:pyridoxal phosphate-dependent aminotransferase [Elusimicrobiota bacterium]
MNLAKRTTLISPSPTLGITAKVNQLRAQGIEVIGFGAGEPDFDTSAHIKEEAINSLQAGFTKYTATSGIPELKAAIVAKFKRDNGLDFQPAEIIVSCGAKHSLYNAIMVLCEKGNEVILASPYWVSYLEMIKLSGARPVIIKTSEKNNFKITPEQLLSKVKDQTKLLILNSPSNPTGMMYTAQELEAFAKIAVDKNMLVISDEIYEKLVYADKKQVSIANFGLAIKERTIIINGVSKTYAMTGWRIGYAAARQDIVQAMANLQDHSTSNPVSFVQKAAVTAISGPQDEVEKMRLEFKKRRDYMVARVKAIKKMSCLAPEGAFYVFANIAKLLRKNINGLEIKDSQALAEFWLNEAKVAVVPGSGFGNDNYVRFSYATSFEKIKTGLDRIEAVINEYY